MCGRYTLTNLSGFKKRFGLLNKADNLKKSYNIAPGTNNPVVIRNSPNRMVLMNWGLIPYWMKDYKVDHGFINARAEGIYQKASFKEPIKKRRCLVPSDGFFEWRRINLEGIEEKVPYYITLKDKRLFSFAGIWDENKAFKGGHLSYAIITTKPNEKVSKVHNRMPVILSKEKEDLWLDESLPLSEVLSLLRPIPSSQISLYPVSKKVNNPKNDNTEVIKRR